MKKTVIQGTGRYLPERLVTNDDLAKIMDTSDEWIRQRTGIEQRFWVPDDLEIGPSDLGAKAAEIALGKAGWKPDDIDLIIFATLSPDLYFPGSGCLLQHKLGLTTTPALDIRQQCSGFFYGLATADAFIKSGQFNRILFVGAEIHSRGLDKSNEGRDVTVIFGDGGGAICLEGIEADEPVGILASALHSQGEFARSLMIEAPTFRHSPYIDEDLLKQGRHWPKMDGRAVFKHAVKRLPEVAAEVLEKAGLKIQDIDLVIPHQANIRINQAFMKAMDIDPDKMISNIHKYGNTTAASIPIALDETIEEGRIQKGDTVLFLGLGAGLTWGSILYRF
ncbi:MAG: ketoacyl-ACP synthase III [Desulfobacteraceae bacterium]|nr:MAG: ketoacyl-ACP synthase III [Desulfobacteraceae bacterium]